MGFYARTVLPRLMDWTMSGQPMARCRAELLQEVSGKVLEVGFGTGLNLPYYPAAQISELTVIDPNRGMGAIARPRLQVSPLRVTLQPLSGEALPMPDASFDSAVSTWTLCSIANVTQALGEIHRVLKPGGKFFFVEHGLSPDPSIQTWQHRLTPLQKRIADGCHLDRPIRDLVEQVFGTVTVKTFYAENLPKVGGYFYQGVAEKRIIPMQ